MDGGKLGSLNIPVSTLPNTGPARKTIAKEDMNCINMSRFRYGNSSMAHLLPTNSVLDAVIYAAISGIRFTLALLAEMGSGRLMLVC